MFPAKLPKLYAVPSLDLVGLIFMPGIKDAVPVMVFLMASPAPNAAFTGALFANLSVNDLFSGTKSEKGFSELFGIKSSNGLAIFELLHPFLDSFALGTACYCI